MTEPDLQRALGRVVINGASLEYVLWLLMRTLESAEDPGAPTNTQRKPSDMAKTVRKLCNRSKLPQEHKARVGDWLTSVRTAQSLRNDFVHGHWIRNKPDEPGMHFLVDGRPRKPGVPAKPWATWSSKDVDNTADELRRLGQDGTHILADITALGPEYQRRVKLDE